MLKFYYDLASPPVRAVYFTIKHLNIPVEMINVKLFQGELRTKEYLKVPIRSYTTKMLILAIFFYIFILLILNDYISRSILSEEFQLSMTVGSS